MIRIIKTRIERIEHKKRIVRITQNKNDRENPIVEDEDLGWFVLFEGSWESIFVGNEQPTDLRMGMKVDIIIKPEGEVHG